MRIYLSQYINLNNSSYLLCSSSTEILKLISCFHTIIWIDSRMIKKSSRSLKIKYRADAFKIMDIYCRSPKTQMLNPMPVSILEYLKYKLMAVASLSPSQPSPLNVWFSLQSIKERCDRHDSYIDKCRLHKGEDRSCLSADSTCENSLNWLLIHPKLKHILIPWWVKNRQGEQSTMQGSWDIDKTK